MTARASLSTAKKLFSAARSLAPVRDLFVAVTAYRLAEILFFSFTFAYAFSFGGFRSALFASLAVALLLTTGYWGGLSFMANSPRHAGRGMQVGAIAASLCVSIAGLLSPRWLSLVVLVAGALPAGAAFAAKQWHEMTRTSGKLRETYFSIGHSFWSVVRFACLAGCATLLAKVGSDFKVFFFIAGLATATLIAVVGPLGIVQPVPAPPQPLKLLREGAYWRDSRLFLLEAGSGSLRDVAAACWAMMLVTSAASYGWLETASSLTAAAVMGMLAARQIDKPSMSRLSIGLIGAMLAWLAFAGSLAWAPLFAAFIILRALAAPVIAATYESLVISSIERSGHALQDSAMARDLSLLAGRCVALSLAAALTAAAAAPEALLHVALFFTLLCLPTEYYLARNHVPAHWRPTA